MPRQNQDRFHHGEVIADAHAHPSAKREVTLFDRAVGFKALWVKLFGLFPIRLGDGASGIGS
jgi:hypothetical protein